MSERGVQKNKNTSKLRVVNSSNENEETRMDALVANGLRVLRRRYKLAIAVFLLFIVPAGIFVKSRPPKYQATARMLVERGEEANSVLEQFRTDGQAPDDFQTQAKLLRSRPVVAKAILHAKLWESPEFALPEPLAAFTEENISSAGLVDAFLSHLAIVQEFGTHILDVTFTSAEPATAMKAANALVDVYIEDQEHTQLQDSAEVVDWLNLRLEEQQARLEKSEGALQAYVEGEKNVSVQDRQNIVVQKLADLNQAATKATAERMSIETRYNQVQAAREAPDTLPFILMNPVIQQLRAQVADLRQKDSVKSQKFGVRHPERIELQSEISAAENRLDEEIGKIIESVRKDFELATTLERSYQRALEDQKREVLDLTGKNLAYGSLERQVTSDRQLYELLRTQAQTRGIAGKTVERKVRVIEAAELPRYPVGPHRSREILLVLLGGLFLALSAPIIRESLDHRVKTPADIEGRLGLTCLAMVPIADSTNAQGTAGPLFGTDASAFNEAFRRIRTAVTLASTHHGAMRVMVTSAVPREGKSVVAVNLAIALAQMNQRVLLIDGDLRRPKVHKMLGLQPFPGFADVLTNDADATEVVRETTIPNLFVLPCGMKHLSTSELLASKDLEAVLDGFAEAYDCIVFDSPPTGPVADACIIGQWVEFTVFVVHAESTPVASARAAIEQLEAAGVTIAGVVLNRVNLKHAGYYAPYYGGQYSDYYSKPGTTRSKRKGRESEESPRVLSV
jgi:capsular exopolysaccharide synthesis family protein